VANFYRLHRVKDGSPVDLNIDQATEIKSDSYGTYITMLPHGECVIVRERHRYSASGTLFFPPNQEDKKDG